MKTVGIRALKNRLSECLRQVRSGESVLVPRARRGRRSAAELLDEERACHCVARYRKVEPSATRSEYPGVQTAPRYFKSMLRGSTKRPHDLKVRAPLA
jgi:hypothetical protein